MKGLIAWSLLPLLASASPIIGVDTIHNDAAPVLSSSTSQTIPDSYIVVFKKDVSHSAAAQHHDWVKDQHTGCMKAKRDLHKRSQTPFVDFSGLKHTYNIAGALLGYSGHFDEEVIERVRRHPDVSCTLFHQVLSRNKHVMPLSAAPPTPVKSSRKNQTNARCCIAGRLYRERFRSPHHGEW
jgi:hypothetical protein